MDLSNLNQIHKNDILYNLQEWCVCATCKTDEHDSWHEIGILYKPTVMHLFYLLTINDISVAVSLMSRTMCNLTTFWTKMCNDPALGISHYLSTLSLNAAQLSSPFVKITPKSHVLVGTRNACVIGYMCDDLIIFVLLYHASQLHALSVIMICQNHPEIPYSGW